MYLVTVNTNTNGYGVEIYVIGLYNTEDAANMSISIESKNSNLPKELFKITKLDIDKTYNIHNDIILETTKYLGGYSE